jgi:hypothetical protein
MAITPHPALRAPSRERVLASRVLELLQAELAALESGDLDALGTVSQAKERAVGQLHAAVVEPSGLAALRDPEFALSLRQISSANAVNGQYLATRMAYTRARLGGLTHAVHMVRAAADASAMYQADGFTGGLRRAPGLFGSA